MLPIDTLHTRQAHITSKYTPKLVEVLLFTETVDYQIDHFASISNKVEANNEEEDEDDDEVFRRQFAKDQSQTGLELNGIAEMIKSLEKVTKDLTEDDDEDDSDDEGDSNDEDDRVAGNGVLTPP